MRMLSIICRLLYWMMGMVWMLAVVVPSELCGQNADQDYRFHPDAERQGIGRPSGYQEFLLSEEIPNYTGWAVDLYNLGLEPWKRLGPEVLGAYINLDGTGGVVNAFAMKILPRGETRPERHLFEEQLMILTGEGETHIWRKNPAQKVVIPWKKGTVFSPPLNTWHRHVNRGSEPVLLVAVTDLPIKADLFRNMEFIFNVEFDFSERYAGQPGYFDPENSQDYAPGQGRHSLSIVNLVRNAWSWRLFHAGQGVGDVDRHYIMSNNMIGGHVEQFPVGTYERGHRHGPGATIVLLSGVGRTLMWPRPFGKTPWKDGRSDQVIELNWKVGTLLIPPTQWYHQHFNLGREPARFINLGEIPGTNEMYPMTSKQLAGGDNGIILFREEDPYVREMFEKELARRGVDPLMPAREILNEMEQQGGEVGEVMPESLQPGEQKP
jgi:oxalate decarboxylase/phosphoglucose isomerase-like protein (cupin superfamily)